LDDAADKKAEHPAIARFRNNSLGFWDAYKWVLVLFAVAVFLDAASTIRFMLKLGPELEIHPMVRIAAQVAGPVAGPLLGAAAKVLIGVFVAIYCRRWAAYILVATAMISLWAAWYNVWGVNMYYPFFVQYFP